MLLKMIIPPWDVKSKEITAKYKSQLSSTASRPRHRHNSLAKIRWYTLSPSPLLLFCGWLAPSPTTVAPPITGSHHILSIWVVIGTRQCCLCRGRSPPNCRCCSLLTWVCLALMHVPCLPATIRSGYLHSSNHVCRSESAAPTVSTLLVGAQQSCFHPAHPDPIQQLRIPLGPYCWPDSIHGNFWPNPSPTNLVRSSSSSWIYFMPSRAPICIKLWALQYFDILDALVNSILTFED